MTKVLSTANSTEAAIGTMIWSFLIAHPKVANGTVILPKLYPAIDTVVGFGSLFGKAFAAYDFTYSKSIDIMMFGGPFLGKRGGHG